MRADKFYPTHLQRRRVEVFPFVRHGTLVFLLTISDESGQQDANILIVDVGLLNFVENTNFSTRVNLWRFPQ